jgi:hypothetical protein
LAFWLFGFLAFWLFGFLAFWLFGFFGFWLFGFLGFWLFGFLAFQLFGMGNFGRNNFRQQYFCKFFGRNIFGWIIWANKILVDFFCCNIIEIFMFKIFFGTNILLPVEIV